MLVCLLGDCIYVYSCMFVRRKCTVVVVAVRRSVLPIETVRVPRWPMHNMCALLKGKSRRLRQACQSFLAPVGTGNLTAIADGTVAHAVKSVVGELTRVAVLCCLGEGSIIAMGKNI